VRLRHPPRPPRLRQELLRRQLRHPRPETQKRRPPRLPSRPRRLPSRRERPPSHRPPNRPQRHPCRQGPRLRRRPDLPRRQATASLIGGASLSSLLSQARRGAAPETAPEAAEQPQPAVTIDPASGQKLESGRTAILDYIRQERPRLYAFFEQLRIEGHTLRLAVPTEALREEILRSKLEMLTRIAAIAGVEGALELEVTINEQIRAVRPIKLEDRLRHMNEKNPLLAELRRELDLEVE